MKQIIAIFLFIFALASCKPTCTCEDCQAQCKTEQVVSDSTAVEASETAPAEVPAEEETEGTEEAK